MTHAGSPQWGWHKHCHAAAAGHLLASRLVAVACLDPFVPERQPGMLLPASCLTCCGDYGLPSSPSPVLQVSVQDATPREVGLLQLG